MKPVELLDRAQRTVASARLLLDAKDGNGASNRAYYAMFDAARAALLSIEMPLQSEVIKTHSGLISAFGLHFIKPGLIPVTLGKALSKVFELRRAADYLDEEVELETAAWAVEQAAIFVESMREKLQEGTLPGLSVQT